MQHGNRDPRIDSMFSSDRFWAWAALIALWALYAFTFLAVMPLVADANVTIALAVAGAFVLLFNSASILTLVSHYGDDKDHIYGLDLHYLDLMNKSKG